jgi:NitT/TauT family transport system substrate-binding protein
MKKGLYALILVATMTLAIITTPEAHAKDPEKKKLTYVEPGRYLIKLPVLLAEAAGYFKEEGLELNVRITPGQRGYEALVAGDSDFVAVAYGSLIKINQQGKKVISVCNLTSNCLYHLVVRSGIKSLYDLKGKRIGVGKVGDEVMAVIGASLKHKGIDPDKDVKWLAVGYGATMIAAMKRGDIDAAMTVGEWRDHLLRAVPGTHALIDYSKKSDLKKYLGTTNYPLACVQMTDSFIKKNPETTQRVVNAIMKALYFINTHTPDECIRVVKDKYWTDADRDVLVKYLTQIKSAFSTDGITLKSGYDMVVNVNNKAGLLDLPAPAFNEITNMTFVKNVARNKKKR